VSECRDKSFGKCLGDNGYLFVSCFTQLYLLGAVFLNSFLFTRVAFAPDTGKQTGVQAFRHY